VRRLYALPPRFARRFAQTLLAAPWLARRFTRIERRKEIGSDSALRFKAGDGDRTRTKSLEGSCAAITPRPRADLG
jgi:hypothetical protein